MLTALPAKETLLSLESVCSSTPLAWEPVNSSVRLLMHSFPPIQGSVAEALWKARPLPGKTSDLPLETLDCGHWHFLQGGEFFCSCCCQALQSGLLFLPCLLRLLPKQLLPNNGLCSSPLGLAPHDLWLAVVHLYQNLSAPMQMIIAAIVTQCLYTSSFAVASRTWSSCSSSWSYSCSLLAAGHMKQQCLT